MNTKRTSPIYALAFVACAATESGGRVEVEALDGAPMHGTSFTCTAHPDDVLTPCYEGARPLHGTASASPRPGVIVISLARSSNAADGGAVPLVIELRFPSGGGRPAASATQQFQFFEASPGRQPLAALGGWIRPVAVSPTLAGRNAGRFSIDFEWGTVAGTYDTDDVASEPVDF